MRLSRLLLAAATAVAAAALAAPALAATGGGTAAPIPPNPWPGTSQDYVFQLQTLFGHGTKFKPVKYCSQSSVFPRGSQVVFRMIITNAKTGKVVTGGHVNWLHLKIQGVSPDLTIGFRPQGGAATADSPWLWSTAWTVPADYPVGTFVFSFEGKLKNGQTIKYNPLIPGTAWEITPSA